MDSFRFSIPPFFPTFSPYCPISLFLLLLGQVQKIERISPILGQESRKRIKEDKERRKVGIGRLGEEEERLEVLVFKKILRVRILEEESSQRVGVLIIVLCGSPLEGEQ